MKYRLKRTWRGKFILQVEETRHHLDPLSGHGYYDEFSTTHWRNATLSEALGAGIPLA